MRVLRVLRVCFAQRAHALATLRRAPMVEMPV
jgi:hypothetical protein